ncbi:hypothetical protein CPSG_07991 [Coccidioides posadasii str. Silveira]|uniref:Uncharacterized protein n=1 Tax=Coccidioides posadasii (strain RMSCC 757 / Silveira) TaxID=443226 RepID=E9DD29_COCPS|nr:hypothetical protein CPSG_07991 [Coccidioides posadasii str. Silveira]
MHDTEEMVDRLAREEKGIFLVCFHKETGPWKVCGICGAMREKRSGKQDQGKFLDKEKRWKKSTNKESLRDISEFERSGYPHETSVVRAGPNGANWRRKVSILDGSLPSRET